MNYYKKNDTKIRIVLHKKDYLCTQYAKLAHLIYFNVYFNT
jgi:hypothetical protein